MESTASLPKIGLSLISKPLLTVIVLQSSTETIPLVTLSYDRVANIINASVPSSFEDLLSEERTCPPF